MATDKQIVSKSNDFEEAARRLDDLKARKQQLKDQLDATQARIDEQLITVDALRLELKTLVNE
jgi:septal ring factor EnvC (AmiA/AmiB activator)